MASSPAVRNLIQTVHAAFKQQPKIAATFERCFSNSLDTTLQIQPDGRTFVVTGDIPAMWLRDSTAQVWPYLQLCAQDAELRGLIAGVIATQATQLLADPYANSFNAVPSGAGHAGDQPERHPLVWERKFELDSLCYPIRLAHGYWRVTGDAAALGEDVHQAARKVLEVMRTEQHHAERSPYSFWRPDAASTDNLPNGGKGYPVGYTGLIWSAFRPSDDACQLNYNIPGNMMASVELGHLAQLAREIWHDAELELEALSLQAEIRVGLEQFATAEHPRFGPVYAYEVDGLGGQLLMDDANIPSLLSAPYLGYCPAADAIYQNTRALVLSAENPYFFAGTAAQGVGSPHTPPQHVWPLALAMRGLTADNAAERVAMLNILVSTTAGTNLMHESFHVDDPAVFTREWFGWANSLFSELVLAQL